MDREERQVGLYDIELDDGYADADSFVDKFEVMILLRDIQEVPAAT